MRVDRQHALMDRQRLGQQLIVSIGSFYAPAGNLVGVR